MAKVCKYIPGKDPDLSLKSICREAIRKHLINIDPHQHLFGRILQLGLPSSVAEYLLYNMSLDDPVHNINETSKDGSYGDGADSARGQTNGECDDDEIFDNDDDDDDIMGCEQGEDEDDHDEDEEDNGKDGFYVFSSIRGRYWVPWKTFWEAENDFKRQSETDDSDDDDSDEEQEEYM